LLQFNEFFYTFDFFSMIIQFYQIRTEFQTRKKPLQSDKNRVLRFITHIKTLLEDQKNVSILIIIYYSNMVDLLGGCSGAFMLFVVFVPPPTGTPQALFLESDFFSVRGCIFGESKKRSR
jgi:hypothetical protein